VFGFLLLASHHLSKSICASSHPHCQQWLSAVMNGLQIQLKSLHGKDDLAELMNSMLDN